MQVNADRIAALIMDILLPLAIFKNKLCEIANPLLISLLGESTQDPQGGPADVTSHYNLKPSANTDTSW